MSSKEFPEGFLLSADIYKSFVENIYIVFYANQITSIKVIEFSDTGLFIFYLGFVLRFLLFLVIEVVLYFFYFELFI
jgi:hypothetical protein